MYTHCLDFLNESKQKSYINKKAPGPPNQVGKPGILGGSHKALQKCEFTFLVVNSSLVEKLYGIGRYTHGIHQKATQGMSELPNSI